MALRLKEMEPGDYTYILTPTGDELPEMDKHWNRLENMLDAPLLRLGTGKLADWKAHNRGGAGGWRLHKYMGARK